MKKYPYRAPHAVFLLMACSLIFGSPLAAENTLPATFGAYASLDLTARGGSLADHPYVRAAATWEVGPASPATIAPCLGGADEIGGNVFLDSDDNGVNTVNEEFGQDGVEVTLYTADGAVACQTTTDTNGDWTCTGLTVGEDYRVEFTLPTDGSLDYLSEATLGAGNNGSVQVTQPGTCDIDYGLFDASQFCGPNPTLVTTCFVAGDPLADGYPMGGPNDAIVGTTYDFAGGKDMDALTSETGSVFGLAYDRFEQHLFSAAFLKRHVGNGPLGEGGIYVTDYSSATPVTSALIDLDLIYELGSVASNSDRGLTANPTDQTIDQYAWDNVGKEGLGGIDLSADAQTLYVTDLFNKRVIVIDLTAYNQDGTLPTAANLSLLPDYPDPGCTLGTDRPFGVQVHQGQVYLGVVCDASNGGATANLSATVYRYDPTASTWSIPPCSHFPPRLSTGVHPPNLL